MVIANPIKEDHLSVEARRRSTPDGGYFMAASERAEISATGRWLTHRHGDNGWCGPEGNGIRSNMGDFFEGCLLVKVVIPDRHEEYVVFKQNDQVITVTVDGECYLTFHPNDEDLTDNDGALNVLIKIYKK